MAKSKPKSKKIHVFKHFKKKKKRGNSVTAGSVELEQRQPLKTVEELHIEVHEVAQTMKDNIVKIRDREGRLDVMVERGEMLREGANQFAVVTNKARRKMWLRSHRRTLIICGLLVFVVIILVVVGIIIILWKSGIIFVDE